MKPLVPALLALLAFAGVAQAAQTPLQPALEVITLSGKTFDLAAQRGHWVVVNFWATWCRPCIKEMPDISRFVHEHPDVRSIGLAFDDAPKAEIAAFVKAHPVVYPIAPLDVFHPPKDFGAPLGLPTTYLIAPDGRVAKKFIGPITAAKLAEAIGESAR